MKFLKIVFIVCVMAISSCVNQPDYNPCANQKPVTSSFNVDGRVTKFNFTSQTINFNCDTDTYNGLDRYHLFSADQDSTPGTQYLWEIGKGRYTKKDIVVNFGGIDNGNNIPIKLSINAPVNKSCFPNDTCCKSSVRVMVWVYVKESALNGTYMGYRNGNPADTGTFIIDFQHNDCPERAGCFGYWYKYDAYPEINNKSAWAQFSDAFVGYKYLATDSESLFLYPDNNTLNYYVNTTDGIKSFIGKRIK